MTGVYSEELIFLVVNRFVVTRLLIDVSEWLTTVLSLNWSLPGRNCRSPETGLNEGVGVK
jgi:hypothetical protein